MNDPANNPPPAAEIRARRGALECPPLRTVLEIDKSLRGRRPCLLLGEAPNHATAGRAQLWLLPDDSGAQHAANRLCLLGEMRVHDYLRTFDRDNLVHRTAFGGPSRYRVLGRDRVPEVLAAAERRDQRLVVLGKLPASCLTWCAFVEGDRGSIARELIPDRELPPLVFMRAHAASFALAQKCVAGGEPIPGPSAIAAYVPHPSGRNPWWNVPANRTRAASFFRRLTHDTQENQTAD